MLDGQGIDSMVAEVETALEKYGAKLLSKAASLAEPLPETATSRGRNEREEQKKQLILKQKNFQVMKATYLADKDSIIRYGY